MASTREQLEAAGFRIANMGGNVQAWRKDLSADQYILITCGEDGQDLYAHPDTPEWLVCSYFHDRPESTIGEDNGPVTLAEALAWNPNEAPQSLSDDKWRCVGCNMPTDQCDCDRDDEPDEIDLSDPQAMAAFFESKP